MMLDTENAQTKTGWIQANDPNSPGIIARMWEVPIISDDGDPTGKVQLMIEHKLNGVPNNTDISFALVRPDTEKTPRINYMTDKNSFAPPPLRVRFRDLFDVYEGKKEHQKPGGMPILDFKELPKATRQKLYDAGNETIESLANLPEDIIIQFGAGARDWKIKARKYLKSINPDVKLSSTGLVGS